tara:strand:+ start:136 stop:270 length:135 start_codon:yes stop_codon:yes gene_type:complete
MEAEIDMGITSRNMGHASVSTTYDIYAHMIPELEDEAVTKVTDN